MAGANPEPFRKPEIELNVFYPRVGRTTMFAWTACAKRRRIPAISS